MLTQNKKIIVYAVISMMVILIMIILSVVIINYLAREINQALTNKSVKATIKGFDFEGLKALGIEEINKILEDRVGTNWVNSGGDRLWSTAANWSGGVIPTSVDKATIRNQAISGPIIDASTTAVANHIVVGDSLSTKDTIDMTGGTLTTRGTNAWVILGYYATNNGIFTLSAGTVSIANNFFVGYSGKGLLQMTGGSITVTDTFGIAQMTGSIADVNLYGGTITVNGAFNMTSGARLDITTGTLIVNGDVSTLINTYKTNGWITAYGGTGTLNVNYNVTNPGKTTITAM